MVPRAHGPRDRRAGRRTAARVLGVFALAPVGLAIALVGCPAHPARDGGDAKLAPSASSAAESSQALPGRCVDAVADARRRLGKDAAGEGMRVDSIDLDLDGSPDPILTHESFCGTGGCSWQLYVARGACAYFVGSMFTVWPVPQKRGHHGLVDLLAVVRRGCAGMARSELETSFDGARYVVDRVRTCACPLPSDHPGDPDPDASCGEWQDAPPGAQP